MGAARLLLKRRFLLHCCRSRSLSDTRHLRSVPRSSAAARSLRYSINSRSSPASSQSCSCSRTYIGPMPLPSS
jgi:hypothetical protein